MTLFLIGIGLWSPKDITLKGLECIKDSDLVCLENYTSRMGCTVKELEKTYGKPIMLASRDMVEQQAETLFLKPALKKNVALLIIGDPFGATTHVDLMLRARKLGVNVEVVNNASILNAIGIVGLELYKFGKTTSIPFHNEHVTTPVDVIRANQKMGLHSLVLLDLDPSTERFMSVSEAVEYLIAKGIKKDALAVGCAGVGSDKPEIRCAKLSDLGEFSLKPQCLVIPGTLHFVEEEALQLWK